MKKVWSLLMAIILLMGTFPALAADSNRDKAMFTDRDLSGEYDLSAAVIVNLTGAESTGAAVAWEGNVCRITSAGTYLVNGEWNGTLSVAAGKQDKVQLVLQNASIRSSGPAALVIESADKVFVTLAEESVNVLEATGATEKTDLGTVDGVIFSKADLVLNGSGALAVSGAAHGIVCKDDLKITGGEIVIQAARHGLEANDSIRIGGGTITVTAGSDGLHTNGDEEDAEKGGILMQDGELIIRAGDDGIHAETSVTVAGGAVQILQSYEGIEGKQIYIMDGDVFVIAEDDALNTSAGTETGMEFGPMGGGMPDGDPFDKGEKDTQNPFGGWNNDRETQRSWGGRMNRGGAGGEGAQEGVLLSISGGTVTLQSGSDGLDSNGDLAISGGFITISGPTRNGEVPIDYNGTGLINGGTVIATGVGTMMLQGFDDASAQSTTIQMLNRMHQAGETITIADEAGQVLASFTPANAYQLVIFSIEGVAEGVHLTLRCGDETQNVVNGSNSVYGGNGDRNFGGPQQERGNRGGRW